MRVFLTGATGFVGSHSLRRLLEAGHEVSALIRPVPGRRPPIEHGRIHWVHADLRDHDVLAQEARNADAVLHTAAEHYGVMRDVDAVAINAIAEGLRGSGKVLISTSASVVYGDTGLNARDESEPIVAPFAARAWRAVHDRRVAQLGSEGVRGVVVRPPTIFGYAGGVVRSRIEHAASTGTALYINDGAAICSSVHVDDLVDAYLAIIARETASGIYNVASDERISRRDFAKAVAVLLGRGVEAKSVNAEVALREQGELALMGTINQIISAERAKTELRWRAIRPGLKDELSTGFYKMLGSRLRVSV